MHQMTLESDILIAIIDININYHPKGNLIIVVSLIFFSRYVSLDTTTTLFVLNIEIRVR